MKLFDFQKAVARHLRAGRNVILQAPTGSGKTIAALWPFLEAWDRKGAEFPRQCIYSVPMRVLANQFTFKTRQLVSQEMRLMRNPQVEIQTGENPDDPKVHGDLVFTTIDQTLSNILCVPYAVGGGSANINAGAVISSYLVFDEFHLFPPEGALKTTLEILALLNRVTPFLLMTATFSSVMLKRLAEKLDAEVVMVSHDELAKIPSQRNKVRCFHVREKTLEADDVWTQHQIGRRSIAICNTVERSQNLFEALEDKVRGTNTEVLLLHARFLPKHRKSKEDFIRDEFGDQKEKWTKGSLILVATQVIEVGLDITCDNLHTEIAPASSVLQRAGRCARFENEQGDVFLYDVPLNKKGERNFAPYHEKDEKPLCEKAWTAFLARSGQVLDFFEEQKVIDEVHTEADEKMLNELEANKGRTWDTIRRAMTQCDPSTRPELIRDSSDSCTLLVHDDPYFFENPYRYRGFSMYRGSLLGKWRDLQEWASAKELGWILKYPQETKESSDPQEAKQAPKFEWPAVPKHLDKPFYSPLYVVNPALVEYDEHIGFRFSANGGVNPADLLEQAKGRKRDFDSKYQLEDYPTHIKNMIKLYRERYAARLDFAASRLENKLGLESGRLDRAVRLAIAFHDVGKMQTQWQTWARNYERAIGEKDLVEDTNVMIAHTHSETEEHRELEKKVKPRRPHHAGEGAAAVMELIREFSDGKDTFYKAVMTAIARHHSPHTDKFDDYRMERASVGAVVRALMEASEHVETSLVERALHLEEPEIDLDTELLGSDNQAEDWLMYLLVVRALRLTDGESQEGGND